MEVSVTNDAKHYGEQAGVWLYADDDNYVKFVIEGMRDGTVQLVVAAECAGVPQVVAKVPLPCVSTAPVTLRLELSSDGQSVSACVDRLVCLQHVATCPVSFLRERGFQIGLSAHGGIDETRQAVFSRFSAFAIAEGRGRF